MPKKPFFFTFLSIVSCSFALLLAEGVIRLKNLDMKQYEIEMWRYAKELKFQSKNPILGHEHIPSRKARLQSVEIRTNQLGMRGENVEPKKSDARRILFLGSSITLGWGVAENQTTPAQLETLLRNQGESIEILNAGVGNYNAARYVELFFSRLQSLDPDEIVVHYFLRDAESLEAGGGNWFLKNSQLAVTLWNLLHRHFAPKGTLQDHYLSVYDEARPGFQAMKNALTRLADDAKAKKRPVYLAMIPDVHDLKNYPFGIIHEKMKKLSNELGITFVDLLPALQNLNPNEVWVMDGDPHPGPTAHGVMAKQIAETIQQIPGKITARNP